jgi:ubiquinone/menaquinone biosynthesis C-methylase UbiE
MKNTGSISHNKRNYLMKNSEYWNKQWNSSAQENIDIRFIDGWGNRTFQELLFSITDISKKMQLFPDTILLDVGCGAGLFEIAFTNYVKEIQGIDYSRKMVETARSLTQQYANVNIREGNMLDLPFQVGYFDRILAHSSIQYLNSMDEVKTALHEFQRVAKRNATICLSLIPDKDAKEDYLQGYRQLGLSDAELQKKIEVNNKAIWFDKKELIQIIEEVGMSVIDIGKPVIPFQSRYYFDITLCNTNPPTRI